MRKALIMLGELSDRDIDWIAKAGERITFSEGTEIITEGIETPSMFIILDGLAVVSTRGSELAQLASGELLGEISMVDKQRPTATVTAKSDVTVLAIQKEQIIKKIREDSGFGSRFYHAVAIFLADRLRSTNLLVARGGRPASIEEAELDDELNENVLDKVYLAGAKFDKLLKQSLKAE